MNITGVLNLVSSLRFDKMRATVSAKLIMQVGQTSTICEKCITSVYDGVERCSIGGVPRL